MASRSCFLVPLALVALVAFAPLLVASTQCQGTSWPCSACSTAFPTNTLVAKCKTCVNDAGAGAWACVNDCSQASVQDPTRCLTCVGATGANAWACSVCNSLTDSNLRKACYDCAENPALQQFGWYCQRLALTPACSAGPTAVNANKYAAGPPATGSGCLGCMGLAGPNNVDACLRCANKPSADAGTKQTCMNCVVARKDGGGSAYSC